MDDQGAAGRLLTIKANDGLWQIGGEYAERSGAYHGFHTVGAK